MKSNLIIPKLCKVGFNTRSDTYSGFLGYVIYNDGKVWRKEKSWEDWREKYTDSAILEAEKLESFNRAVENHTGYYNKETNSHLRNRSLEQYLKDIGLDCLENHRFYTRGRSSDPKINPIEFENIPMEGFVLNRKVGGNSTGWNHRQTYCRVYDPRGFEFEITIPNLLYILENSNSIKGKGLEGKFIYSWDGKDLVLLPENAPEFKDIEEYNSILTLSVKKADLVEGNMYLDSKNNTLTFMGEHVEYNYRGHSKGKKLWWYTKSKYDIDSFFTKDIGSIKKHISVNPDYSSLMDILKEDRYYKERELIYEKATEDSILKNTYTSYSYGYEYEEECYILEKNKYKKVKIYFYNTSRKKNATIQIGRREEEFTNIKELLNKYELWQLAKTTK